MMNYKDTCEYWSSLSEDSINEIRWRFFGEMSPHDWETGPFETALDAIPILDHGYIALLDHMGTDIDIVNAARISFDKASQLFDDDDRKLLNYLYFHNHTSPFEMVEFKFVVKCPLFVARQWMRHRTWSYNEVSRRYTDEDFSFYDPQMNWIRKQAKSNRQASEESGDFSILEQLDFMGATDSGIIRYNSLIDAGVCREQARMVLPQSMYTKFIAKVDLSNLLHFIELRMEPNAQWEIQQYSEAIIEMIRNIVPETMDIFLGEDNA